MKMDLLNVKVSPLLEAMNDYELRVRAIKKADTKGINREVIDTFCDPRGWSFIYKAILFNMLNFKPDHQGEIDKKGCPGEKREVSIGTAESRIIMAIVTEACFKLFPEMIHPRSVAYQKGIGTGKVVRVISNQITKFISRRYNHFHYYTSGDRKRGKVYAVKVDFHNFFDTVYKEKIYMVLDMIEDAQGFERETEPVMNMMRRMYADDRFILKDGTEVIMDRGLRQGNAFASFLANAVLYDLDEYMTLHYDYYVRYCDDSLILTTNPEKAKYDIERLVSEYGVSINPRKLQDIKTGEWFKFLGFSLRDDGLISMSKDRLKTFEKTIKDLTIRNKDITLQKAINKVYKYLYVGDGEYSFATSVLPTINCRHDIDMMNRFVMDCLRAVETKKRNIYGLGYQKEGIHGVIPFECGTNVAKNREKIPKIDGYDTISFWKNLLINSREVYKARIRIILNR